MYLATTTYTIDDKKESSSTKSEDDTVVITHSEEVFAARWELAKPFGWIINDHYVSPPDNFACLGWSQKRNHGVIYDGKFLEVPGYFWDDSVMETGTWKKE
jgi:hypothetical protein